jgi:hypothetical protein
MRAGLGSIHLRPSATPAVVYGQDRYVAGDATALTRPSETYSDDYGGFTGPGFFGPNFQASPAPEPSQAEGQSSQALRAQASLRRRTRRFVRGIGTGVFAGCLSDWAYRDRLGGFTKCGATRGSVAMAEPGESETEGKEPDGIPPEWLAEFEAAARRTLEQRVRYGFIKTYRPVLDDAPYRAFDTMEDYRRWCEESLPDWLGFGRVPLPDTGS